MSYEEKIEVILYNRLNNGDNEKAIESVKTWLCCEWQCDDIFETSEYKRLLSVVDEVASRIIQEL